MKRHLYSCHCLFVLAYLLCSARLAAQPKQTILTGTIMVETGEKFPYKIEFTESEGSIKGYAYTFSEPQQTKAVIKGVLDRMDHTLRFKETEILSSHGVRTKAFMCLVNARLQYTHTYTGGELKGPITSADIDKAACTPGNIVFNNDDELRRLFAPQEKFDTIISMKKREREKEKPVATVPTVKEEHVVTDKVTAGVEKTYEWHSDTIVLDAWDGGNIDGDRITIICNGKTFLTQHYLTREKKNLRIPIEGSGINTLVIAADNEGSDPPNTATLTLADGSTIYNVVAYNPKGQKSLIKIKRVKP